MISVASRLPFLFSVALVSAAIGDAVVETVANGGTFGPGFDDNNHLSVVPALVAGTMLGLVFVAARCWSLVRSAPALRCGDPFVASVTRLAHGSANRDVPIALVLQFAALYAMEGCEQLVSGGKLLGGTAWLGGPVAFAVAVHALLGVTLTLLVASIVRSFHACVASLVRATIDGIRLRRIRAGARAVLTRSGAAWLPRPHAPYVRRIRGRAPPLPLVA